MRIKTWIKYEEAYIPPRCRKERYREKEEYIYPELKEIRLSDCKLAFEDNSFEGKGKIYYYNGKLWAKTLKREVCGDAERFSSALDAFSYWKEHSSNFFYFSWDREKGVNTSRLAVVRRVNKAFKNYLLIDGALYGICSEPMYKISTFGLGHNHGGTSLFVTYNYNPNISHKAYFSALKGKEAVECANLTAAARGDTNDLGKFEEKITVYMPELVKRDPEKEHGDGNPLLNMFEEVIEKSADINDAAMLTTAMGLAAGK